jgi:hypothetical protein
MNNRLNEVVGMMTARTFSKMRNNTNDQARNHVMSLGRKGLILQLMNEVFNLLSVQVDGWNNDEER